MSQTLTSEQIKKLQSLGISVDQPTPSTNKEIPCPPSPEATPSPSPEAESITPSPEKTNPVQKKVSPVFPLLSISGLTILSFGGVILLKSKDGEQISSLPNTPHPSELQDSTNNAPTPTQVPKSIQHYLLTSQQYFSQALQYQQNVKAQNETSSPEETINLLNQSILAASEAIKEFPKDHRGYYQRGRIYQSLADSQPEMLKQTISDLVTAQKLNPSSAEITHDLASAFARKGDTQNTINYLSQTVALDPTKAQNFYDLARIQQQAGLLPQALNTYTKLLTLVTDPQQKQQVEAEKQSLEKLVAQTSPADEEKLNQPIPSTPDISFPDNPPTIQALANDTGLIIAAPETGKKIEVENMAESNSLAGTATLPIDQKEISIVNTNLNSDSQVYVTIVKGGKNQNLQVLSKSNGSFTVGLDSSISEEIEFKWWIIN